MRLKVAVLEEDAELREDVLLPQLRQFEFDVEGFATSDELFQATFARTFDLLVLGIDSPGGDGFTTLGRLRENSPIGIVVLAGRHAPEDRVRGLTEGADAWLVKPDEIEILSATLHSLVRRMRMAEAAVTEAQPARWRLSPKGWRLHAPDDRSIVLNQPEWRLLVQLFGASGQLVGYDELIAMLTQGAEGVDRRSLEMLIHRLRRKVSAKLGKPLPLHCVRGYGYVIFADGAQTAGQPIAAAKPADRFGMLI